KRYRGKYVGAAGGELFVADTPQEIDRLIKAKYPDEHAHVRYIPREKRDRIYACHCKWLMCDDGVIRPSLVGMVRVADASMLNVTFLLDAGADRTVFSARFL